MKLTVSPTAKESRLLHMEIQDVLAEGDFSLNYILAMRLGFYENFDSRFGHSNCNYYLSLFMGAPNAGNPNDHVWAFPCNFCFCPQCNSIALVEGFCILGPPVIPFCDSCGLNGSRKSKAHLSAYYCSTISGGNYSYWCRLFDSVKLGDEQKFLSIFHALLPAYQASNKQVILDKSVIP